jgi:hypothetical protein
MAVPTRHTAAVKMSTGVLHLLMPSCVGLRGQPGTSTTSDDHQAHRVLDSCCLSAPSSIFYQGNNWKKKEEKKKSSRRQQSFRLFQCVQPSIRSSTNWQTSRRSKFVCVLPRAFVYGFCILLLYIVRCFHRVLVLGCNAETGTVTQQRRRLVTHSRCQERTTH